MKKIIFIFLCYFSFTTYATPNSSFPEWAYKARIAGAFFEPWQSDGEINNKINSLKNQQVSVILADCPLGWSYSAWVDNDQFQENLLLLKKVVNRAHQNGLKVVWYLTGLELIALEEDGRDPAEEHPEWVQISIDGEPVAFDDIGSDEEHWLEEGDIDVWISPSSPYKNFYLNRVRAIAETGVDGIWVDTAYLQHSIGRYDDLWPSYDQYSLDEFYREYQVQPPREEDWDKLAWRKWIIWRHKQIKDFLIKIKNKAKKVNPSIIFFEENWNVDSAYSTFYANDPAIYSDIPDLCTGHEVSTIGDRTDLSEKGMSNASPDQWRSFVTMIKFARGMDREKPAWILTYGYKPDDAERLAGVILANQCQYYETKGPSMANTVGQNYRKMIFSWIKNHADSIYKVSSIANLALLYSSKNRDFIDQGGGDLYNTKGSIFFKAYREDAQELLKENVAFDIINEKQLLDQSILNRYEYLILPNITCLSDEEANAIRAFSAKGGKVIKQGSSGERNEWAETRAQNPLSDILSYSFSEMLSKARKIDLPPTKKNTIYGAVNQNENGTLLTLSLINLRKQIENDLLISLSLPSGANVSSVILAIPGNSDIDLSYNVQNNKIEFTIPTLKRYVLAKISGSALNFKKSKKTVHRR